MWNSNFQLNCGIMQTSRRSNKKFIRNSWERVSCANCMGNYSTRTLRHHWKKCTGKSIKGERVVKQLGKAVEGRVHPEASDKLNTLFSKFRDNEGIRSIQFDWLAICYGNELCTTYSPHYQEGYIRSKISATAKLLNISKSISPEITDLSSVFAVKYCQTVVESIRKMAKFDEKSKMFGSPGTAATTVTLINALGDMLIAESIRMDDEKMERNAERFLKVFQRDARFKVNKLVSITIARKRRHQRPDIPTTTDVNKLAEYLDKERTMCFNQLQKEFEDETWLNLAQLTLVSILVFNRKRPGELCNLQVSDFHEREIIDDQSEMLLEAMLRQNNDEINSRIHIRGKKETKVTALLKRSWEDCIHLLIENRKKAGLDDDNDFLFAVPTQSGQIRTINAYAAMNSYAGLCGAENPSSLKVFGKIKFLRLFRIK